MTPPIRQGDIRNGVLAGVPPCDFAMMAPHLKGVDLPVRRYVEWSGKRVNAVFFIEDGLAAVVAVARPSGCRASVALIGREGMTGFSVVWGAGTAVQSTLAQTPCQAYAIDADILTVLLGTSHGLRAHLLLHGHVCHAQTAAGALAHAVGSVEERLARWLLMMHDRLPGDELAVTHDLLAIVLGVRRPGITIGLGRLEREGLISLRRGAAVIRDRCGLIRRTNGLYGAPEAEYERLFGPWRRP